MALSNWLTRDEWNACYFAGLKEKLDGRESKDLGTLLHLGIIALHESGYKFKGIEVSAEGGIKKVNQCCEGNESCLAEIIDGTFDPTARAKECLKWVEINLPSMDWSWLQEALTDSEEKP